MAPLNTPEETVKYLLLVMKNIPDMPKPNYQQVAVEGGINNANNAQKRFKKIVEDAGYALVDGKVVDHGTASVHTPKKPRAKRTNGEETPSKKRKLSPKKEEGGDEDEGVADIAEDEIVAKDETEDA